MKTPVNLFLLRKKHKKNPNSTAKVMLITDIMIFKKLYIPELSTSKIIPIVANERIDKTVTTAVIALGKN